MPVSNVSEAIAEAYASGQDDGVTIVAVTLSHPGFDGPIYLVTGLEPPEGDDPFDQPSAAGQAPFTVALPLADGETVVPHTLCAFDVTRPGFDQDGPTDGKIAVDGVSGLLREPLRLATGYDASVSIEFRFFVLGSAQYSDGVVSGVTEPDETISGLYITNVQLTWDQATADLVYEDGRMLNVPTGPNGFFDRENYPALFASG